MNNQIKVGVGGLVVNEQGQLFLALRGKNVESEQGMWEFPGGGVDYGESLIHAICREFKEEYGFEIKVKELLGVYEQVLENQHWVCPGYLAECASGEPCIMEPDKCEAIGWFYPHEIPQPLTPMSQAGLKDYLVKIRKG